MKKKQAPYEDWDPWDGESAGSSGGRSSSSYSWKDGNPSGTSASGGQYSSPYSWDDDWGAEPPRKPSRPSGKHTGTIIGIVAAFVVIAAVLVFVLKPWGSGKPPLLDGGEQYITITQAPNATQAPKATQAPTPTKAPKATQAPTPTKAPKATQTPKQTQATQVSTKASAQASSATQESSIAQALGFLHALGSAQAQASTQAPAQGAAPQAEAYKLYDPSLRHYVQALTAKELRLFKLLYDVIAEQEESLPLDGSYTDEEIDRVMTALNRDCPELIGFNGAYSWSTRSISPKYVFSSRTLMQDRYERMIRAARAIPVPAGGSEYDREMAIYDWFVKNCTYDHASYDANVKSSETKRCYDADAALIERCAVCDGFADAFVLVCRMNGLKAIKVEGTGNGNPHAWNMIRIEGKWYQADVTWDICGYESYGKAPPPVCNIRRYCNLTDEQMEKDHCMSAELRSSGLLPTCNSTDAAYLRRNKDMQAVDADWKAALFAQLDEAESGQRKVLMLRFDSKELFEEAKDGFFAACKEWKKKTDAKLSVSKLYWYDENRILYAELTK